VEASDTFVTFEAPDKDKILHGAGEQAVVRLVLYDNRARRTSGVTADSILTLKGTTPPLPLLLILGSLFGVVVLALLVVVVLKSGGRNKRGGGGAQPLAPVVAGGPAAVAQPYQPPAGGYSPPANYGPPPVAYGAQPAAPPGYAAVNPGGSATAAVLQGSAGTFTILSGQELKAGRDPNHCGILLNEPRVSGVHATLKFEHGQLLIRDENSNNGTLVNNVRLTPSVWSPVPSGSLLRLGPVELSVRVQ
jgi:hypothetical protein